MPNRVFVFVSEELYVVNLDSLHEDLYRIGNSTLPNFNEDRVFVDCRVVVRAGIKVVIADGNGFSTFNHVNAAMRLKGKNIWKLRKGSVLPIGLTLSRHISKPSHILIAPVNDMPVKKYLGLLEELATNRHIAIKLTPQEIRDAK